VVAIDDDLYEDVLAGERGAGQSRIPMPEGTHGVEEVRHRLCAACEGRAGLLGRGVAVAARDDNGALAQQVDQLARARKLRGKRDEADRSGRQEPFE
jgi:hypothetical protein